MSCHTHPNDRLLQQPVPAWEVGKQKVVIPILTIGFYNEDNYPQGQNRNKLSYPS